MRDRKRVRYFFIQYLDMSENGVKSGTWENRMKPLHGPKRRNKPLVEKKRRARINESLAQLKALVLESMQKNHTGQYSKLEKADILEMTVKHLVQLKQQVNDRDLVTKYQVGYNKCASEVVRYLGQSHNVGTETRTRLVNHLSQHVEPEQYTSHQPRYENEAQTQSRSGGYLMMLQSDSNVAPVVTNNTIYVADCVGSYGSYYNTNIQNTQNTNHLQSTTDISNITATEYKAPEETSTYTQLDSNKHSNEDNTIAVQSSILNYVTPTVSTNTNYYSSYTEHENGQNYERQDNTLNDTTESHNYTNLYEMPLDNIGEKEHDYEQSSPVLTNMNIETSLKNKNHYPNIQKDDDLNRLSPCSRSPPKGQLPPFQVFRETLRQNSRSKKQEKISQQNYCTEKYSTNLFKRYKLGLVNGNHPSSSENISISANVEANVATATTHEEIPPGGILGLGSNDVWRPW